MASCTVVNVQCPNGRRQKVKLTAHMTLFQVIQEVCKKQDLDSNKYNLKHQRKTLDSSLTIRFANLPNNAHLELIESADGQPRSAKKCVVALQLENGERLVHEFNSDVSLFDILMHWKSQSESVTFKDNLEGVLCIFANQQIRGLEKLQKTTLSMIGLLNGGRGVIRLIQPSVSKPDSKEPAMTEDAGGNTTKQPEPSTSQQESSVVEPKQSSEEMDVASASTSSMSVASEDDSAATLGERDDQAAHVESLSSQSEKNSEKNDDRMDFELSASKLSEASQSGAGASKSKKKGGKTQDTMEIEQCEVHAGVGGGEISSRVKVDSQTQAEPSPPLVESVPSTSDGRTSRSVTAVQAFSGQGRTLSESGPDVKKPRFHSPPSSSSSSRAIEASQQPRNAEFSNIVIPEREPVVFRLGDSTSLSADDVSDDFFEVTVNDLRLMLKDLKNERTAEKPLMTTKMREERERSKMEKYERVTIRVYFPDQTVLQGFFSPTETVSSVASFINDNLRQKDTNFYLYTTPPPTVLDQPNLTLFEAKLFPAAIVHFGCSETQGTYLHSRHLQDMADFTSANAKVEKYNRSPSSSSTREVEIDTEKRANNVKGNKSEQAEKTESASAQQDNETRENVGANKGKTVPKWFRLGK